MNPSLGPTTGSRPLSTGKPVDAERRRAARVDCHTVVTAVATKGEGATPELQVFKTHSEDVSVSGARLLSNEPLPAGLLYLRFLLPAFGERYVEAEVVSETHRKRQWVTGKTTTQYVYGVQFTGVMTDDLLSKDACSSDVTEDSAQDR